MSNALGDSLEQIVNQRESTSVESVVNFLSFSTAYTLLLLLLLLVMLVHIKNRAGEYKLLKLMGIKKKHRRRFIGCEFCGIILGSTAGGILLGMGISSLLVKGVQQLFSDITSEVSFGWVPLQASLIYSVQAFINLFFMIAIMIDCIGLDAVADFGRKNGKKLRKRPVMLVMGLLMIGVSLLSLWFYWGKVSSSYPIMLVNLGLLLTMTAAGGYYLSGMRKREKKYFKRIVWLDNWFNKFSYNKNMSVIIASFVLFILYSYGISLLDSLPLQREENYPYDLVWMANQEDEEYIDGLEERYGVVVKEQPCIRVASGDSAEHMGIPESVYEEWTGKKIQLKDDEIHVVYQRNRSDYSGLGIDFGTKEPRIFIGNARPDLWLSVQGIAIPGNKFDKRYKLTGEEDAILTGVFRDAVSENVVVFSDEYYNKVCTDAQGANLAVMMDIPKHYEEVVREVYAYAKEHSQQDMFSMEESNLIYEKKVLALETRQDNLLLATNAVLNILLLLVCGVCVLLIKLSCDYPDMEWKYHFFCQTGMPPQKIRQCIRKEIFTSAVVPVVCGLFVSIFFVLAEIYLKHMPMDWVIKYIAEVLLIALGVGVVFGAVGAIAAWRSIVKIERGNQNGERDS